MKLPPELDAHLTGYALSPIRLGESGARVFRCISDQSPARYLKVAAVDDDLRLDDEAERLQWMKDHDLSVPAVCTYARSGRTGYLLLEEMSGLPASDPHWKPHVKNVMVALGEGMALLHRSNTHDCPFDHRLARQIEEVRRRIDAGRVDEDDFDAIRAGRRASDLFAELLSTVPEREDLVFAHGDFSLPNIILRETQRGEVQVAGFIDCGRSGVADRHQDVALAIRSIVRNFGSEWVTPFLHAYGLPHPDPDTVAFFTLLDEFF